MSDVRVVAVVLFLLSLCFPVACAEAQLADISSIRSLSRRFAGPGSLSSGPDSLVAAQETLNLALKKERSSWLADRIWIEDPEQPGKPDYAPGWLFARKTFTVRPGLIRARAWIAAEHLMWVYVNGRFIGKNADSINSWGIKLFDPSSFLHPGPNILAVRAFNTHAPAFAYCEGILTYRANKDSRPDTEGLFSDTTWKVSRQATEGWNQIDFDDSSWPGAIFVGKAPPVGKFFSYTPYIPPEAVMNSPKPFAPSMSEVGGVPGMVVEGQPVPLIGYFGWPDRQQIERFAASGGAFYTWDISAAWTVVDGVPEGTEALDAYVSHILAYHPNAYFLPRIRVYAPDWWLDEHPDHVSCTDHLGQRHASYGSLRWINEAGEALRRTIRHVASQRYAGRFVGAMIVGGSSGEWFLGYQQETIDRTPATVAAWRQWCKEKYGRIDDLRRAWHEPDAELTSLEPPSRDQLFAYDMILFKDPARSQKAIDWILFYSDLCADAISHFADIVAEESRGKMLTGAFYGYVFGHGPGWGAMSSHLSIERLFAKPTFHFMSAPVFYGDRGLGGNEMSQGPLEASRWFGKMAFDECDLRLPEDHTTAVQMLRRALCWALVKGNGLWWMADAAAFAGREEYARDFRQMHDLYRLSLSTDRSSAAEVAVVIDPANLAYATHTRGESRTPWANLPLYWYTELFNVTVTELLAMGAPFDFILLDQIGNPGLPSYRLYVFMNSFYLSDKQRSAIERHVKRNGSTVLWFYAPGLQSDRGVTVDACSRLTGIALDLEVDRRQLRATIVEGQHPLLAGVAGRTVGGIQRKFTRGEKDLADYPTLDETYRPPPKGMGPVLTCTDPGAAVLARYASGEVAMALKDLGSWKSIWCGTLSLPSAFLRNVCRFAGVHVYSGRDQWLVANRSWLAFQTREPGSQTIRLPRPTPVYDCFAGRIVAQQAEEFSVEGPPGTTCLFYLGKQQR